jgi:hypothetical protein
VLLHRTSRRADKSDRMALEKCHLEVQALQDRDHCAHIDWRSFGRDRQAIVGILNIPSPQGMTGIGHFFAGWRGFRRCRFGESLAANDLDAGVALLVKLMSAIGVPTRLSGHGLKDMCEIYVSFQGKYAFIWFKAVFQELLAPGLDPEVRQLVEFRGDEEGGYGNYEVRIGSETRDPSEARRFYDAQFEISCRMMDEHWVASVQQAKKRVCDAVGNWPDSDRLLDRCRIELARVGL